VSPAVPDPRVIGVLTGRVSAFTRRRPLPCRGGEPSPALCGSAEVVGIGGPVLGLGGIGSWGARGRKVRLEMPLAGCSALSVR
jgi:hypothetical protein